MIHTKHTATMEEITLSAIYRTLPPVSTDFFSDDGSLKRKHHRNAEKILEFHPGVQQPSADPDWSAVREGYESLINLLCSSDSPDALVLLEDVIDEQFVGKLLDNLIDTRDPREAQLIGELLPLIWSCFGGLNDVIWKAVIQTLSRFLADSRAHIGNGIWEILFFLATKMEEIPHRNQLSLFPFLLRLHKPNCFAHYNQPLVLCLINILKEDDDLADFAVSGILKHWPRNIGSKEALMLQEIRDIITDVVETKFICSVPPLFRRLDHCLRSHHFLVVKRALELLNAPALLKIAVLNRSMISLFAGGLVVATEHWNLDVVELAVEVRQVYLEIDEIGSRKQSLNTGCRKTKIAKFEDRSVNSTAAAETF